MILAVSASSFYSRVCGKTSLNQYKPGASLANTQDSSYPFLGHGGRRGRVHDSNSGGSRRRSSSGECDDRERESSNQQ